MRSSSLYTSTYVFYSYMIYDMYDISAKLNHVSQIHVSQIYASQIHASQTQRWISRFWLTLRGSHGLSARRARRTKSRGPKGLHLEVGARRAPRLLVPYNSTPLPCYQSAEIFSSSSNANLYHVVIDRVLLSLILCFLNCQSRSYLNILCQGSNS